MSSSAPTRRNGASKSNLDSTNPTSSSSSSSPTSSSPATPSSPLLPTSLETLLLSIYPGTLLLGSLFSLTDPAARNAPYNPATQSHPSAQAPSYFALKRNFLNDYFVKINWFWVSLAYILFLLLHRTNGPQGLILTPRRLRGLLRYGIATAWWIAVTQWFFGPALIDRGFLITGGACELADRFEGSGGKTEFVTAKACRFAGGAWRGGHDISGHVFILVLGGAFLGMELLPVFVKKLGLKDERTIRRRDGWSERVVSADFDGADTGSEEASMMEKLGTWTSIIVTGLSWWMLLMTATYFHTWFEKLTGLLTASSSLFVIFFLPRAIPVLRDTIGLPGV